jgi:hypothetical protein
LNSIQNESATAKQVILQFLPCGYAVAVAGPSGWRPEFVYAHAGREVADALPGKKAGNAQSMAMLVAAKEPALTIAGFT